MRRIDRLRLDRVRKVDINNIPIDFEKLKESKERDEEKFPIRIDSKTIILVSKDDQRYKDFESKQKAISEE
jgi:hypothetical protein